MKNLIFIILLSLLLSTSLFSQVSTWSDFTGTLKLNFDLGGKNNVTDVFYSDSLSGEQDINTGFTLSLEGTANAFNFLSLGVGVAYQFQKSGDLIIKSDSLKKVEEELTGEEIETGKFGYIPIYAIMKLTFLESKVITPNIIGHFGYNLFYGDDAFKGDFLLTGGVYYGAGISLDILDRYQLDVLYKENRGKVSHAEDHFFDTKYSSVTVSLGVNF